MKLKSVLLAILTVFVFAFTANAANVKVGFVVPSTIDDMAWSQAMYEGLKAVQAQMGEENFEIGYSERLGNPVDAAAAIRQYASQGYNIVIAHGAQYQSLLNDIAPDFPEVTFAYGTGYAASQPNIFAYDPHAEQGAYLMGIVAGFITKSNIIGIVGPVEGGDAVKYNKGFAQGVKAANPKAEVRIAYTGSFNDLVGAGEIARAQIKAGADFLSGSSQQAIGAMKAVAEFPNTFWFASDLNPKSVAPDAIMGAQVYNFTDVVKEIVDSHQKGELGGRAIPMTIENGLVLVEMNRELPPEVQTAFDKAKEDIVSGKIKIELK